MKKKGDVPCGGIGRSPEAEGRLNPSRGEVRDPSHVRGEFTNLDSGPHRHSIKPQPKYGWAFLVCKKMPSGTQWVLATALRSFRCFAGNERGARAWVACILAVLAHPLLSAPPAAQVLIPDLAALAKQQKVVIPEPPAWIKTVSLPLWSVDDVAAGFKQVTDKPPQFSYSRTAFVRPDHAWLVAFDKWFRQMTKALKIGYVDEVFDCDNFARCFVAFADLAAMRGGENRGSICLGWATVFNREAFSGVAAGGAHAVVIVGTSDGLFVVEPQSGKMVALTKYPNRDEFVEVNL